MRNRYDGSKSGDAAAQNARQSRFQAEHSSNDAHVKKIQAEQAMKAGKKPNLKGEAMHFNAYMCNNGEHAQEFARDLTAGLDKSAFPVK